MGFFLYLVLFLPVAALTGGIAGAIVGRGREDRPLWQNAVIGLVGWLVALTLVMPVTGTDPEEANLGHGLAALLVSIIIVVIVERRRRSRAGVGPRV
jgi:uncharacterized membrane protein YeaQ/YmgE (transglycosylase-associated protein family)